jgi:hypothetical protein
MKIRTAVLLVSTHCTVGFIGFAVGIYALPILTAPPSPSKSEIATISSQAMYTAEFRRDLQDSDALHWGRAWFQLIRSSSLSSATSRRDRTKSFIFLRNLSKRRLISID